jgi:uncharacterized protein YigE (DUF2233 family)
MIRTMTLKALAIALLLPGIAEAASCVDQVFEDRSYTTCTVTKGEDLRLFLAGPDGPYGSFTAVNAALAAQGKTLGFAMNAGMFHRDLAPVGLYIEEGQQTARLVTRDGPGNFGLLPNGVFCIDKEFSVIESRAFKANPPNCRFASQSGPMLVIDGQLHPRFLASSDSVHYRNGVGIGPMGQALFVISNDRVNFHSFARFFRDTLGAKNALYFDGSISRLYATDLDRHDAGFPMGPMIGTVVTLQD